MPSYAKFTSVYFVAMFAVALSLGGCGRSPEAQKEYETYQAKAKAQMKNPEVTVVGTFDGCEVKFYERSRYASDNFYIAKCAGDTTAVTSFSRTGGKHSRDLAHLNVVTQEVAILEKKMQELNTQQEILAKKKAEADKKKEDAIKKAKELLSKEELAELGIKEKK